MSDCGVGLFNDGLCAVDLVTEPADDVMPLLDPDIMVDDFEEWLQDTPLLERLFRDAAIISGLVERRHLDMPKRAGKFCFNDLIYDVLPPRTRSYPSRPCAGCNAWVD